MENGAPFTSNDHYFRDYREKFLKSYREARKIEEVDYFEPVPVRTTCINYPSVSTLPPPMRVVSEPEEPIAQDPYDQALHHMASARAYFQGSHQPKVLYLRWITYRPFSCVQAAHGL